MLKKTMTYEDFDGNKRTEDFYFNLTKAECLEFSEYDYGGEGGLMAMLNEIITSNNQFRILEIIKKIISKAYGKKSPDGRRFIKSDEIRDEFMQTNAYSDLYIELMSDANKCVEFMKGVCSFVKEDEFKNAQKQLMSQYPNFAENAIT